jgi:hypothetical protein
MALMGKYIYCFIKEKEKVNFGSSTIAIMNAPVYTITYKDISAVVSDAPVIEYDPSRKNILAHQQVITRVINKYTIIPVAFGTIANNKKEVEFILTENYTNFIELIEYFKNKIELGLKITWDKDYFNQDIEDKKIKELKEFVSGKDENIVLNEKIELGQLVEAAIVNKREEYKQEIYNSLKKMSVESKLKETVPIKTVFNAYFLIDKAKEDDFDKAVGKFDAAYKNKLIISYTGPWPPYNFIDIKINMKE